MRTDAQHNQHNTTEICKTMATKYQVQCMDENIYADEAYGEGSSPLFSTATEAENFMAECINDWPEGSSVREAYEVHEVEAYLDDEE